MIVNPDIQVSRIGNEEAVQWIDEKIEKLRRMILQRPDPRMAISEYTVIHWQRIFMAHYGKILGALETLAAFDILSVEMVKELEQKLKFMIQSHHGFVMIGED